MKYSDSAREVRGDVACPAPRLNLKPSRACRPFCLEPERKEGPTRAPSHRQSEGKAREARSRSGRRSRGSAQEGTLPSPWWDGKGRRRARLRLPLPIPVPLPAVPMAASSPPRPPPARFGLRRGSSPPPATRLALQPN